MGIIDDKRIRIVSGHYGVGKSEFAANYAVKLAQEGLKVTIIDLDVINPYFTTRGIESHLSKYGVSIVGPSKSNTAHDVPALPSSISALIFDEDQHLIFDLGGDKPGAKILGQYHNYLEKMTYDLFYLINTNRPFSGDYEGAYEFYRQIEDGTRLSVTKIVNSTHMLFDTTVDDLNDGETVCIELSKKLNIIYKYLVAMDWVIKDKVIETKAKEIFPMSMMLRPDWLDTKE